MADMIREIALRLKGMRDVLDIPVEDMAAATGTTPEDYLTFESGEKDFSFTFLYKSAQRFGIDLTDLMTGESPHLTGYTLVRSGEGLPIKRRKGFAYLNVASMFRDRISEPFIVTAPYDAALDSAEIMLNSHAGQEMDYILSGSLKLRIGEHEEIMHEGDTIYYDSDKPHGMVATDGAPCRFLAIVMSRS
jgi:mannose-6-phosphate isomerase-like protein (cupin superfamily)